MLSLRSERWSELEHAYGNARDIPALLGQLRAQPGVADDTEPWFSLWSALAHQGDIYAASFAAVPHVIDILAEAPDAASVAFLHFPAWVEICRAKAEIEVPDDLQAAYFESLARLPELVARTCAERRDLVWTSCSLAAIAAAQGHHAMAEALLEMAEPDAAEQFLEWYLDR